MRGKPVRKRAGFSVTRITPARAGKTRVVNLQPRYIKDHPRACGENRAKPGNARPRVGSPPRVRGKRGPLHPFLDGTRITPARAGKTNGGTPAYISLWDHPRACGENTSRRTKSVMNPGSPPRVRGKRHGRSGVGDEVGITPARAGKTARGAGRGARAPDHPRACGENASTTGRAATIQGSPPRVRGKLSFTVMLHTPFRITPARAGKTYFVWTEAGANEDHPRACGENTCPPSNSHPV